MAKIKFTKSELKHQRDALKQYLHFLPTLQLKKQQLQLEIQKCQAKIEEVKKKEEAHNNFLKKWIGLFSLKEIFDTIQSIVSIKEIQTNRHNIAGLDVPVLENVVFEELPYDLFYTMPSLDDAIDAVKKTIQLKIEEMIMRRQIELISNELRITSQRVNLFEKVKIPEAKENIRKIQIYLGDEDTAAVGRSKIAKRKMMEVA
ncbi:MAG TPA: V-type ATP synthase subunit D [Victivallales bacterium]|nr:V-type ATP synthase subunit D [Victivallales bacterium]HRR05789.1 V-type ATP synthase subunit D [Victivallales bacterium]HRR28529.1 V-type ATP synthase subunit D [Victivallales bacterium]HRU01588.1 V-type ATP synthase subunit D [Victivallales bacterium]